MGSKGADYIVCANRYVVQLGQVSNLFRLQWATCHRDVNLNQIEPLVNNEKTKVSASIKVFAGENRYRRLLGSCLTVSHQVTSTL